MKLSRNIQMHGEEVSPRTFRISLELWVQACFSELRNGQADRCISVSSESLPCLSQGILQLHKHGMEATELPGGECSEKWYFYWAPERTFLSLNLQKHYSKYHKFILENQAELVLERGLGGRTGSGFPGAALIDPMSTAKTIIPSRFPFIICLSIKNSWNS